MDHIEQLVQRYKEEGDQVVAYAIYTTLQPYTVQLAYGLLGNKEDADDISQEAWIKVFNSIEKYDPQKSAFKTWVTHIMRNQCIDFLRKQRLRKIVSLEWLLK
jgi:RNA polymerase sigma-70 factor (ECF subfamily)